MSKEQFWFIHGNIEWAFLHWLISYEKKQELQNKLISYYNRMNGV